MSFQMLFVVNSSILLSKGLGRILFRLSKQLSPPSACLCILVCSRERESRFSIIFHLIFCYGLYITCFFHGCILSKIWCDPVYTLQSQYLAKNIISKDFINIQYKIVCFPVLWKNIRYRDGYQLQTKISKWISDMMMENI